MEGGWYTDPVRLVEQYSDSVRLRARAGTHAQYGTNPVGLPEWVLEQLEPEPGSLLLDAGCGYGSAYHPALAERRVRVVGLDRSRGMLQEAAAGCLAVQGDLVAIPFADGAFDRVMCNHVLYHVPDRAAALAELRRVTCRGGRVAVTTNSHRTMRALRAVTDAAAAEVGEGPPADRLNPFRLEDVDEVAGVFPGVEVREYRNLLVFPDADAVITYVATTAGQERFLEAVRRRVERVIAAEGAFRVETVAGCFLARV